uniref:beta-N-acetylhexosaminidase n=1 Tax=Candidatus Fritschea bemisiae TaxID=206681 RepID=Q7X3A0_9BACT|nr:putative glycosylhydrolase [Candidatus Fritschea bemisiae]
MNVLTEASILCESDRYEGWAEKIFKTLTVEEKIGQLFIVPACPKFSSEMIEKMLDVYHIGALILKQAHPKEQIPFLNALQKRSKLPLLCTGDAEWGLGMRMQETLSFPRNEIMGKVKDQSLLFSSGKEIGRQCRIVGIHLNFAPVVDINNHPNNTVIGNRSFGSDPEKVSRCASLIIQGMRAGKVLSCLKHFPGHGDTDVDSHKGLPTILHSRKHLEQVEFLPFKENLESADAIMTGHLMLPVLDKNFPASLSKLIVTDLLQKEWGFKGLIITDALNMKALTQNYSVEEIALKAFLAGHDLLLYGSHRYDDVKNLLENAIPLAYKSIQNGIINGEIDSDLLDARVLKILQVKERLGLHKDRFNPNPENLMEVLHSKEVINLIEKIKNGS